MTNKLALVKKKTQKDTKPKARGKGSSARTVHMSVHRNNKYVIYNLLLLSKMH